MLRRIDDCSNRYGLYAAWFLALAGALGSLYLSDVIGLIPCTLCWYQRILLYPLVVILGIASFRDDEGVVVYAQPLAVLGAVLALYHYLLQMVPALGGAGLCRVGVPCAERDLDWLGFINIPLLSLLAFGFIALILWRTAAARR